MKTREETLAPRPRNATNRVPMVVTYHPSLPNIGSILRELQPLLHCSEKCRKAIKDVPFMAFRRSKSLGDYLVHAKLRPSTHLERGSKGTVSTWNREKGLPLTELERAILLTTNWTIIVVILSTCCPVRDGSLFMGMTGSGKNRTSFENFSCRGDGLCVFFLNKETGLLKKST